MFRTRSAAARRTRSALEQRVPFQRLKTWAEQTRPPWSPVPPGLLANDQCHRSVLGSLTNAKMRKGTGPDHGQVRTDEQSKHVDERGHVPKASPHEQTRQTKINMKRYVTKGTKPVKGFKTREGVLVLWLWSKSHTSTKGRHHCITMHYPLMKAKSTF